MKGLDLTRYSFLVMTVELKLHYLLARHGYVFVSQISEFRETLYVHHSNPRLSFARSRYRLRHGAIWNGEHQKYMSHPLWHGNITEYLQEAELLYRKHGGEGQ